MSAGTMRTLATVWVALVATAVATCAATVWLCVAAGRAITRARHAAIADRATADRARVEALADVDVLGGCCWCGGRHDQHPATVHADEVAERVRVGARSA